MKVLLQARLSRSVCAIGRPVCSGGLGSETVIQPNLSLGRNLNKVVDHFSAEINGYKTK